MQQPNEPSPRRSAAVIGTPRNPSIVISSPNRLENGQAADSDEEGRVFEHERGGGGPMQSISNLGEPQQDGMESKHMELSSMDESQATAEDVAGQVAQGSKDAGEPRTDLHEPETRGRDPSPQQHQMSGMAGRIRDLTPLSSRQTPIASSTFCVLRSDPPPASHVPYEYMVILPFRNLGRLVIGSGGRTKREICDRSRLAEMRILFTSDGKCFLHLFGSKAAIRAALAEVKCIAYRVMWWQLNTWERGELDRRGSDWAEWSDHRAERLEGAWLKDHYADFVTRQPNFPSRAAHPYSAQTSADHQQADQRTQRTQRPAPRVPVEQPQRVTQPNFSTDPTPRTQIRNRTPSLLSADHGEFRRSDRSSVSDFDEKARGRSRTRFRAHPSPNANGNRKADVDDSERDFYRSVTSPVVPRCPVSSFTRVPNAITTSGRKRRPSSKHEAGAEQQRKVETASHRPNVERAAMRDSVEDQSISVPIDLVTRFIGTNSCAPCIELTASTRLKVEIVSGEAKIWLQGGDISKARKMVEEVIQKATHEITGQAAQGRSSSPVRQQLPHKHERSPSPSASSAYSYGIGGDRLIRRGSDYTPDTSFEKRSKGVPAAQPYDDGEALESRLRRAAYESAAKRKKREQADDTFGAIVQDRHTLARVQDWVEGTRQEQSQHDAHGRRASFDSRVSSRDSPPTRRNYRYEDRDDEDRHRSRRPERDAPYRAGDGGDRARDVEKQRYHRQDDWRRRDRGPPGPSERWAEADPSESRDRDRDRSSNVHGDRWAAKGWHQTYRDGGGRRR